jgi:uncharacterized tellurite resistance protein B-like protein
MLKALKRWMEASQDASVLPGAAVAQRELLAAAAGLVAELMRVDLQERPEERAVAAKALTTLFASDPQTIDGLLAEAGDRSRRFASYYAPVSLLKRRWGAPERVAFIEALWRIAHADGQLDAHEDHFVRKIAHLLYVSNTDCILARNRARAE